MDALQQELDVIAADPAIRCVVSLAGKSTVLWLPLIIKSRLPG